MLPWRFATVRYVIQIFQTLGTLGIKWNTSHFLRIAISLKVTEIFFSFSHKSHKNLKCSFRSSVCRLARQFTGCEDMLVYEGAYHGNLGVLVDVSTKVHAGIPRYKRKPWVHTIPVPNTYNGKIRGKH